MKYRSLTHIYFTRSIFESQVIHYPKYNVSPSYSLQDMKPNRWTIKYRSLAYIYFVRSMYVSQWSIIPTMMFIHQLILKILSKIPRPWNTGHVDLYLFCGQKFGSHCLIIWKYDTHASNSLGDIRQSHRTMKYRSHRPTFILRSNIRSYWPLIPKYDVHTSNSLQDIMQNNWAITTKTYIYFEVKLWVKLTHNPK